MSTAPQNDSVTIDIGGMAIALHNQSADFRDLLTSRYAGFIRPEAHPQLELAVDLFEPASFADADDDVTVKRHGREWEIRRGDFSARWDLEAGSGSVRQSANPYAIDSALRIAHSLILAREGGFLVHAASAIRNERAFLFAGVSGAGKTTISRLAPSDAALLTDEISYVRRQGARYYAFGTPFAGELARVGENRSAPLAALFLLAKGPENRIEEVAKADALRSLLSNILFFAEDEALIANVFRAACEFVDQVPVRRLIFVPDERVWEIIR